MFRNTFQSGFLSILYAIGSKPLQIWRKNINNGYVKRITDFEMQSSVIEICGANVSTCFLTCPSNPKQTLGVKMPFLVLLIKYLKKYFTFEVQVIDDKNVKRRFRASNYQSNTRVKPFICTIPMKLVRVQIHANCRIRRIYFTDQLLSSKSIPAEYRAFSNAQDDNAEEQYQNQLNNEPNQIMQGEEQYQAEYQEEHLEEQQHMEGEHEQEHQGGEEEGGEEGQEQGQEQHQDQGQEQGQQNQEELPKNEEQNQKAEEGVNAGEEQQKEENNNAGEGAPQEPPAEQ